MINDKFLMAGETIRPITNLFLYSSSSLGFRIATFLDKVEPVIASVENPQLKHFLQGGG